MVVSEAPSGGGRGAGCAFVTGGSSGIGLAVAMRLARDHGRVALFARDRDRLERAVAQIAAAFPATVLRAYPVDVGDPQAVERAMAEAVADLGAPRRVVISAGLVRLGETDALTRADHRRLMDVNFFGSLWTVRALLPHLERGAAIGLIGSAAGIIGIYGYAAYAPSKFALRGLAEILRVELRGRGIGVTLCLPPDTETPMLKEEEESRSMVTARLAAEGGRMSADAVARALIAGMERGRFLVLPNLPVRLTWYLAPFLLPWLQRRQERLLRHASAQMFAHHMDEHRQDPPPKETDREDKREAE